MTKKKIIFLILLVFSALYSYFNSKQIYYFYNNLYYVGYKGENAESMLKKAVKIYKEKNYIKAQQYLSKIEMLFPLDLKIKRLAGLNSIAVGEKSVGAKKILYAAKRGYADERALWVAISVLYEKNLYGDIVAVYDKLGSSGGEKITFMYGVSLFKVGRFEDAKKLLSLSKEDGEESLDLFYYLGLTEWKLNNFKEALGNMEYAERLDKNDKRVIKELIRLYNKTGKFAKAAKYVGKK